MEAPKPTKENYWQYTIKEEADKFIPLRCTYWIPFFIKQYYWARLHKSGRIARDYDSGISFDTLEEAKAFIEKVKELPKYHTV